MARKTDSTGNITVSVPNSVIEALDEFSEKREMSRSQVVAKAIRAYLVTEYVKDLSCWDSLYNVICDGSS